jgi:hypothetical protein
MGDQQLAHGTISLREGGCRPVFAIANRSQLLPRVLPVRRKTSTEAALPACEEKIVKSGGNLVEENVRQTTSFKTKTGFPDMKL